MGQKTFVLKMEYGSHRNFPLQIVKGEADVAKVKDAILSASVFGVPPDAGVTLNGEAVSYDAEIQNGDVIKFCKATGKKANGE